MLLITPGGELEQGTLGWTLKLGISVWPRENTMLQYHSSHFGRLSDLFGFCLGCLEDTSYVSTEYVTCCPAVVGYLTYFVRTLRQSWARMLRNHLLLRHSFPCCTTHISTALDGQGSLLSQYRATLLRTAPDTRPAPTFLHLAVLISYFRHTYPKGYRG